MSDFSFTFPIYEAIDLKLTLTVSGSPFDLDAFLAGGSAATFRLELDTGSITRRVITTTDVTRESADATNVATIHLAQNEVPVIGTWAATLTAGPQVWAGTAVVTSLGTPTVTAGGATTFASVAVQALPLYTSATLPTPSAAWDGRLVRLQDPGVDGITECCRLKADGSYEWIIVAF